MVIVRSMGGLGNQFFQYALYVSMSRKRPVALDISWHGVSGRPAFRLGSLSLPYIEAGKQDVERLSDTKETLAGRLRKRYFRKPTHYREDQSFFNQRAIDIDGVTDIYLDGYWQSPLYFADSADDVRRLFFPEGVRERYRNAVAERARGRVSVSIHVRRGDYLKDSQMYPLGREYYDAAILWMRDHIANPVFFVCSDDIGYCKTMFAGDDFVFVDWNASALDDLYTMAVCENHIIANSSFSWWGAFLLDSVERKVVYPNHWFRKIRARPSIAFMFPPSWVGI